MTAEARREQILGAIAPAVLKHGAAVTSRQLAQAANVAEGTLFRTFGDKEALLLAFLEREMRECFSAAELSEVPGEDGLEAYIDAAIHLLRDRFARANRVWMALGHLAVQGTEIAAHALEVLRGQLAEGLVPFASRMRISREAAAEILISLVMSSASEWGKFSPLATREDIRTVLMYGIVRESTP